MPSFQHRTSRCVDKTVVRSSYLPNGNCYIGKTVSWYWISLRYQIWITVFYYRYISSTIDTKLWLRPDGMIFREMLLNLLCLLRNKTPVSVVAWVCNMTDNIIIGHLCSTLTRCHTPMHASLNAVMDVMMTSPNGNIFRVTGPLCGEFIGHRWIPLTKASDAGLWCFLWSGPE